MPAIFLVALLFGRGPGYYSIAVSMIMSVGLFLEPFFRLVIHEDDAIPLALFLATSLGIAEVTEALTRLLDRTSCAEQENALLLEELEHRTKNDLQMIASVLTLQANSSSNNEVNAALRSAIGRIQVVARAHERLQRREPTSLVHVDAYLQDLCQGLGELLRDVRPIAVRVDAERMELPTSVAVHLGLLTNELVTNAFKYAFPNGRGGTIQVGLSVSDGTSAQLSVVDDGIGCPDGPPQGLGTRLTTLLARQLGGTIHREVDAGCRVVVTFPLHRESFRKARQAPQMGNESRSARS